jgi:hypothetical protein
MCIETRAHVHRNPCLMCIETRAHVRVVDYSEKGDFAAEVALARKPLGMSLSVLVRRECCY